MIDHIPYNTYIISVPNYNQNFDSLFIIAGLIPLFMFKEEEISLARERTFRDRRDPLEFHNDLKLVQRYRFSRTAILKITELIVNFLESADRSHAAYPHVQVCEADYVNRHFYHSINVQTTCLPDGRFCDLSAKFPGSVHGSRIWNCRVLEVM